MATEIEMNIGDSAPYPKVVIEKRVDAELFVGILKANGVAVNLREVKNPYTRRSLKSLIVRSKTENSITATDGTGAAAPKELLDIISVGDSYSIEIYKFNHIGGFQYNGRWYGRKTDEEIEDFDRKLIDKAKKEFETYIDDNRSDFERREKLLPGWAQKILDENRQISVDQGENFETKYMGWGYILVALELAVLLVDLGKDMDLSHPRVREFENSHGLSGNQVSWARAVASRQYLEMKEAQKR